MATFDIPRVLSGPESIYDYVRRRWDEMRSNLHKPQSERTTKGAVSNDAAGANAAAKLIFIELKKSPTLVTEVLPPDYTYIERIINNPGNPITWVVQKTGQAAQRAARSVAVNLDKPAQVMKDWNPFADGGGAAWNALPFFLRPRAIMLYGAAGLAAYILAPRVVAGAIQGMRKKFSASKKFRVGRKNA